MVHKKYGGVELYHRYDISYLYTREIKVIEIRHMYLGKKTIYKIFLDTMNEWIAK